MLTRAVSRNVKEAALPFNHVAVFCLCIKNEMKVSFTDEHYLFTFVFHVKQKLICVLEAGEKIKIKKKNVSAVKVLPHMGMGIGRGWE